MKLNVKGLVFVGFAAAVFAGAANADTTVTSKTYVDSKYVGGSNITVTANQTTGKNDIAATTGAVADGATTLVTGDAVHDYVATQISTAGGYYQSASASGQEQYVANGAGGWVALTKDSTPTENSTNPITSGAVYSHTSNNDIHVTSTDKTNWNGKVDGVATGTSGVGTINVTDGGETTQVTVYGLGTAAGSDVSTTGVAAGENDLVTGDQVATAIAGATGNLYTAESGSLITVDNTNHTIGTNAQANVIETVQVNGTALTPDANKAVNVTVPTTVAQLTDAANYEVVANKSTSFATDTGSNTKYPSVAAVEAYVTGLNNNLNLPANNDGNAACSAQKPCALVWTGTGQPTWEQIQQ
ncbi:MAG: hypothetical protein J5742_00720 [Alphaproteobacteria bacterium]|nr:hypothetical protein [Alphaproteobacteria bacterium]